MPRVSVIVPVYNRRDCLLRAVRSALNQTFADLEVIVVDDASTDGTMEVLDSVADSRLVRICSDRNLGGSGARNLGIRKATGELIAFLDSDDEWLPGKLHRQMERFAQAGEACGVVYCGSTYLDDTEQVVTVFRPKKRGNLFPELLVKNFIPAFSMVVVRKKFLDAIGGFDESFRSCQDWDLLLRLSKICEFEFVDDVLGRSHAPKKARRISTNPSAVLQGHARLLSKFKDDYDRLTRPLKLSLYNELSWTYANAGALGLSITVLLKAFGLSGNPRYLLSMMRRSLTCAGRALAAMPDGASSPELKDKEPRSQVLMVTRAFPPLYSGAAIQSIHLAKALRRRGVESVFITDNGTGRTMNDSYDGFPVSRVQTWIKARPGEWSSLGELIFTFKVFCFVLKRRSFHTIHFHGIGGLQSLILPFLRLIERRVVIELTLVGSDDPITLSRRKLGFLFLPAIKTADVIVPISSKLEELCFAAAIRRERIVKIPVGVDVETFRPLQLEDRRHQREKLGLQTDGKIFISIGRLEERKNQLFILKAWKEIRKSVPDSLLVFLGPGNEPDNSYFVTLQQEIRDSDESEILFRGMVSNTAEYMQVADCLLHAALNEGLPNVLVEARSVGLPIVCRKIEGVTSDVVTDHSIGMECMEDDAGSFARSAVQIVSQAALDFSDNSSRKNPFAISEVAGRYIEIYGLKNSEQVVCEMDRPILSEIDAAN